MRPVGHFASHRALLLGGACLLAAVPGRRDQPSGETRHAATREQALTNRSLVSSGGPISVDSMPIFSIPVGHVVGRQSIGVVLANHDVMLITRNGRSLVGYDSRGDERWKHDIAPTASGGFTFFFNLFRASPTSAFTWDHLERRLTRLDRRGVRLDQRRVDGLPSIRLMDGRRSQQYLSVIGQMSGGALIATTSADPRAGDGVREDSVDVFRVDRAGKRSTIGRVLLGQRYSVTDPYLVQGEVPFGRAGRIAVSPDAWFYTDGEQFRIERRDQRGAVITSFGVARSRRPVDVAAKRLYRVRAEMDIGVALRPSLTNALTAMAYPDSMPAYSDLHVDAVGVLWAEVFTPSWEKGAWDLFDARGRHLGTVQLPPELRVLDISTDALLAHRESPGGVGELRLYRINRVMPK